MEINDVSKLVNSKYVHQIRSGVKHRFVDITIVEVEGRFFIRQYKFGEKSWYHAFLEDPCGEIKIGDTFIPVKGVVPHDLDEINSKVNWAYHKKLPIIYFLMRFTYDTRRHEASTLELIPKMGKA